MMRMRFLARPAGALMVLGLMAACGGGDAEDVDTAPQTTTPPAAEPAAGAAAGGDLVAEGMAVYNGAGICMTCHGAGGAGPAMAPNLTDDIWLWADASQPLQPQIESIIRQGVPEPKEHPAPMLPMAGVSLSDQQITALAAYVASL